jgi:hypothetical protein
MSMLLQRPWRIHYAQLSRKVRLDLWCLGMKHYATLHITVKVQKTAKRDKEICLPYHGVVDVRLL